jgi:3-oxoacyl-[acyl-carrier-protein] synthase-3
MKSNPQTPNEMRAAILKCLRLILPDDSLLPEDDLNWVTSGLLDSMGHVDLLLCIEKSLGLPGLFNQEGAESPRTISSAIEIAQAALSRAGNPKSEEASKHGMREEESNAAALILGWGTSLGGIIVPSKQVDAEFGLRAGTLKERAGIETLRRATSEEDIVSLAKNAALAALQKSGASPQDLDWILATSETFLGFPSFATRIHIALLAPQSCRPLDIGGGCTGIPKSLAIAESLISSNAARNILVISADVHSRILAPGKVPGEFGGLFGDGACAFLISRDAAAASFPPYSIHSCVGGCAGMYSSALQLRPRADGSIDLTFRGEALAQAAIDVLEKTLGELEIKSGKGRESASAFALHQPNHRVMEILMKRSGLPLDKFPLIANSCGNLGASTCGAALSAALDLHSGKSRSDRGPIFVAGVAPGIVWDGVVLD